MNHGLKRIAISRVSANNSANSAISGRKNGNGTVSARTTHPKTANTRKVMTLKVLFLNLISIEKTQNYGFLNTRCHNRYTITSMAEYRNTLIGLSGPASTTR